MRSIDGLVKQRPIRPDDRFRFRFILLKEFNAIVSQSRVSQLLEIFGAGLSARIEQVFRQLTSARRGCSIPTRSRRCTRCFSPAIQEGGPFRKNGREDAMLHVKHGDMLMNSQFEALRIGRSQQPENLLDVEVVRDGETLESTCQKTAAAAGLATFSEKSPSIRSEECRKVRQGPHVPDAAKLFSTGGRAPGRRFSRPGSQA